MTFEEANKLVNETVQKIEQLSKDIDARLEEISETIGKSGLSADEQTALAAKFIAAMKRLSA